MQNYGLAIMVIIDEDNKLLFEDRRDRSKFGEKWAYFGGKIEPGEQPEEAVRREVKEELGFVLKDISQLYEYDFTFDNKGVEETHHVTVFVTRVTKEEITTMHSAEGAGMGWFTVEEAEVIEIGPFSEGNRKIIAALKTYLTR